MRTHLGLEALIHDLWAHGIVVDSERHRRLQHVFQLASTLSRKQLRTTLACALTSTPEERSTFDQIFNRWVHYAEWEWRQTEKKLEQANKPVPGPAPSHPAKEVRTLRGLGFLLGGGLLTLVVAVVVWWLRPPEGQKKSPDPIPPNPTPPSPAPLPEVENEVSQQIVSSYSSSSPILQLLPKTDFPTPLFLTLLTIVSASLGLYLWGRYRKRARQPGDSPAESNFDVDLHVPRIRTEPEPLEILTNEEARSMVWSVGKFVSEDLTRRVDLDRTVDATARAGGVVQIHRKHAVYPREVWLWQDAHTRNEELERLVRDHQHCLHAAGLPVRVGSFYSYPERVVWEDNHEEFAPEILDGHRQHALVAILTDGKGLAAAFRHALVSKRLESLFQNLSAWPHLTFVDFSHGASGIDRLLQEKGIRTFLPKHLSAFFANHFSMPPHFEPEMHAPVLRGELRVWAAALALGNCAFDAALGRAIRRRLDLSVPVLQWHEILRFACRDGVRWRFRADTRRELVDWLRRTDDFSQGIPSQSWLGQARQFWRQQYAQSRELALRRMGAEEDWDKGRTNLSLQFQEAFLDLWDQPLAATEKLQQLSANGLKGEIREELSHYTSLPEEPQYHPDTIELPWEFDDQLRDTRQALWELNFGKDKLPLQPEQKPPWNLVASVLACVVLSATALCVLALKFLVHPAQELPEILKASAKEAYPVQTLEKTALGHRLYLGNATFQETIEIPFDHDVIVRDDRRTFKNPEEFDKSLLFKRGKSPGQNRPPSPNWPRRSLVVIEEDSTIGPAQAFAAHLLDSGAADVVLLSLDWREHIQEKLIVLPAEECEKDQLLLFLKKTPKVEQTFAGSIAFTTFMNFGIRLPSDLDAAPPNEVWPSKSWNTSKGKPLLGTGPKRQPIDMVDLTGGEFPMGSPEGEKDRDNNDEKQHSVQVSAFSIGRYEVTREEYRSVMESEPKEWSDDPTADARFPANHITWYDMVRFCNALSDQEGLEKCYILSGDEENPDVIWNEETNSYRLPTEAEWEYACRADTTTRFSFDDETKLPEYANTGSSIEFVGQRKPNDWGLHDMHGNVWEWCWDWYRPDYENDRRVNPIGPASGNRRVLRGGSFFNAPWSLRSACRNFVFPGFSHSFRGFRVVRSSRRQP